MNDHGTFYISLMVIGVAIAGWLSSTKIPQANSANENLVIRWNIFLETRDVFSRLMQQPLLIGVILAISWFWFIGATILTILPGYTKNLLVGNELVVTLLLALFTIGIGSGAVIVGKTGVLKKSLKWIVIGGLGISFFSAHLYWNSIHLGAISELGAISDPVVLSGWQSMFENSGNLMILLDIIFLGLSGGFFIVPLYVTLQEFSEIKTRSRTIAANNISNAFFMVCSALITLLLLSNNVAIETLFILLSIANILVMVLLFFRFSSEIKILVNPTV